MRQKLTSLLLMTLIAVSSCSFTNKSFETSDEDKLLLDLITYVLEKGHYNPTDINDDFSVKVFEGFIGILDPTKRFFLESDIAEFEKYKFQIDDQIRNTEVDFFNVVHQRLIKRIAQTEEIHNKVLAKPFDYTKNESIFVDYEEKSFPEDEKALAERWRVQLKYYNLPTYDSELEDEEKAREKDSEHTPLSKQEIEVKARKVTQETMKDFYDWMNALERKDYFVQYLNTIVDVFDPHTFYFAPEEKKKFDTDMSGKYRGIGARLSRTRGKVKIVEVISGGPVWRDKLLEVGDEILKVGQAGELPVDITGMQLDDSIKLIKGPEGTVVELTVRRVDGTVEVVSITRDIVKLEEAYAKSVSIEKEHEKFGLIHLPKFYVDFEDYNKLNAAKDVAKEVERLKKSGMEGLVLDLRDNGGGSLKTVVEMAGLFIKDGPIVQVQSSGERKEVYEDKDERIQWDGPLVILVNELSASASEILAAAMQDYKRGIVIGSKQTFGKGTVQNVIPLNNIVRSNEHGDLGAIKITTQKFYRINGGSTQLEGVKSDVVVPDRYSYIEIGERDQDNPLPWDKISPAEYQPWDGYIDFDKIIADSEKRMAANSQIKLIDEHAQWLKGQQDTKEVSLQYSTYIAEKEADAEKIEHFKSMSDYDNKLTFESLAYEKELFNQDALLREKRDRWHQELVKDVYVEEAINVLQDLKVNSLKKGKLAIKD
ncbi:carboxy terminal-processing peptidase [Sediminicola luteus]|uniref:Tail-specific protease n=1 Tax=Sediminicola luteus TaxID=319238 RepID=A0A2A4GDU2_9FLAO|nr:carboxy terminal-processing peptidase [Sediminicola luteus]PCE66747.1 tail-specific protease [Sediminicola luteus]